LLCRLLSEHKYLPTATAYPRKFSFYKHWK
jgi:hypothetical protein